MDCVIYKSSRKADTYLFVQHEDDFSSVPEALLQALGKLELVMHLELTPQRTLAQADATQVSEQIRARGFYLQLPPAEPGQMPTH